MNANRFDFPKIARLAGAMVYAAVVAGFAAWRPKSAVMLPLLLIALGLPLALRLVPRNYLYGLRTPRTLRTTEETWYRQNAITGVVMVAIGAVWLVAVATR